MPTLQVFTDSNAQVQTQATSQGSPLVFGDSSAFLSSGTCSTSTLIFGNDLMGTSAFMSDYFSASVLSTSYARYGIFTTGTNIYVSVGPQPSAKWTAKQSREHLRKESAAVQRAKNSIKRALKLMDGVGFGNDVRVFLGGDSIEVSHPESMFKFLLTKSKYGTLLDKTRYPGHSTPYNLQLYTKTNVHVANLCVYMEKTPVLDQVLALSMYIKSGNEDLILKQANWTLYADDDEKLKIAEVHPMLSAKLRLSEPSVENSAVFSRGQPSSFLGASS